MKRPADADSYCMEGCGTFLVHLGDETLGDDLCAHFARAGFVCERRAPGVIAISHPGRRATRRAVEGYLRLWQVMHPQAPAFLTGR